MNRLLTAAAMALAFAATPAFAETTRDTYAANTVVATAASGAVLKFHFNPNGAYTMSGAEQPVTGAWNVEGSQFCITPQGGAKSCTPHSPDRKVGDTWSVTGAGDIQYSVTITAGR